MALKDKISLAFSGGGFRATFYSLGALRRLVELGLWENVGRIDSVSGGSITAAQVMIALSEKPFEGIADFDRRVTLPLKALGQSRFRERISLPVFGFIALATLGYTWLASILKIPLLIALTAYALLLFFIRPAKLFGINYLFILNAFFKNKLMPGLPDFPQCCVNATCLNTGKRFSFRQDGFGGEIIGFTRDNDIKVAFAVACSAAPPPVFTPYSLPLGKRKFAGQEQDLERPRRVFLCDGGIYDNLGAENILQEKKSEGSRFIIIDAGQYIPRWFPDLNPHSLANTSRIVETAVDQIILLKRKALFDASREADPQKLPGTVLTLEEPLKNYLQDGNFPGSGKLPAYDIYPDEIDKMIAGLRTDLDSFHDVEIDLLLWAGAVRMDIALKRYFQKEMDPDKLDQVPAKPPHDISLIKKILTKGRRFSAPLGFLHKNLKGA